MNTWIRRGLWTLGALAAAAAAAVAAGTVLGERKMNRRIDLAPSPLALRDDGAAVARGHYLFASRGCADCHGSNGAGRTFVDDGHGLKLAGPNISPGPGSVVAHYAAADWERTLRHGVKPDGRPLMIMPSEDYNRLTDGDIAAVAAYVRSLPPVSGRGAVLELPLPVRVLYGYGLIEDAAAKIDHRLPPATPVAEGVTFAHGEYVANMCKGCHGAQLKGGKVPGAPPDWPAAADLTPGAAGVLARYPDADALLRLFKTGQRPDGSTVKVMPFESLREMNEVDARALHLFLSTRSPDVLTAQGS
jgi:mono/diheme cytochrome c family protein